MLCLLSYQVIKWDCSQNNIETNMDVKGLFDVQPEHYC